MELSAEDCHKIFEKNFEYCEQMITMADELSEGKGYDKSDKEGLIVLIATRPIQQIADFMLEKGTSKEDVAKDIYTFINEYLDPAVDLKPEYRKSWEAANAMVKYMFSEESNSDGDDGESCDADEDDVEVTISVVGMDPKVRDFLKKIAKEAQKVDKKDGRSKKD